MDVNSIFVQAQRRAAAQQRESRFPDEQVSRGNISKRKLFNPNSDRIPLVRREKRVQQRQMDLVSHIKQAYSECCDIEKRLHKQHRKGVFPSFELGALHEEFVQQLIAFLSLCCHPSATPQIRALPVKYKIPARLWDIGIHAYLSLLRPLLPDTKDQMSAFIFHVYANITTLLEMDLLIDWSEILGDLSRYRLAIEEDDQEEQEHWTEIAKDWYLKGVEKTPEKGRLWHHLAILESDWLKVLNYTKSLFARKPFSPSKESILTVFDPSLSTVPVTSSDPLYNAFISVLKALFLRIELDDFDTVVSTFVTLFDTSDWIHVNSVIFIGIAALWNFGAPTSKLYISRLKNSVPQEQQEEVVYQDDILPPFTYTPSVPENPHDELIDQGQIDIVLEKAAQFLFEMLKLACMSSNKDAALVAIYMCIRHMHYLASFGLLHFIEHAIHWDSLLKFLNSTLPGREVVEGCTSDPTDEEFKGMVVEYPQSTGPPLSLHEKILILASDIAGNYDGLSFDVVFTTTEKLSLRLTQNDEKLRLSTLQISDSEEEQHVVSVDDELQVEGESEAIRLLRDRRRELKAILEEDTTKIKTVDKKIRFGEIVPQVTILVFDTNILVSHLDVLKAAVDTRNWTILIPLIVITELDGLKNSPDPLGPSSVKAINTIETYLHAHRVRIITHKGNTLTSLMFRSEDLEFSKEEGKRGTIDDRIIDTAISLKEKSPRNPAIESVALVTGDRNMRIIATARGVKTLNPSSAKRIIYKD